MENNEKTVATTASGSEEGGVSKKRIKCAIEGYEVSPKTFFIALPFIALMELTNRRMLSAMERECAKIITSIFDKKNPTN